MREPNDGQDSALTPAQRKPKRHTGKFIDGRKRQAIITALANGDHIRAIAKAHRVSVHTVYAVRDANWQQVASRKERIAAQAELNATLAGELITAQLQSPKADAIPLTTLNMTFGINVDKLLNLRGDPIQVQHTHEHIHAHITPMSAQDILAKLPRRNPKVEPPQLTADPPGNPDALPSGEATSASGADTPPTAT